MHKQSKFSSNTWEDILVRLLLPLAPISVYPHATGHNTGQEKPWKWDSQKCRENHSEYYFLDLRLGSITSLSVLYGM